MKICFDTHIRCTHSSQTISHFDFSRYIYFTMHIEKIKQLIIWDGWSSSHVGQESFELLFFASSVLSGEGLHYFLVGLLPKIKFSILRHQKIDGFRNWTSLLTTPPR